MATTHRMSKTRPYWIWCEMKQRCNNSKNKDFRNYGAKGISVCQRWMDSFANFYADLGYPDPGLSLDRINPDGNYCPENCRWATMTEQSRNLSDKSSKTGCKGVSFNTRERKFKARIYMDKKPINLGTFSAFEDARCARKQAEQTYWGKQ